jgi:hypothetical protein
MDEAVIELGQTEEDILMSDISDEALELSAGTDTPPPAGLSLNFSSFHLHCC